MKKYIGFVTKGLEEIAKKEILEKLATVKILGISDKRVIFETEENFDTLLKLKTLDDLCVFLYGFKTIENLFDLEMICNDVDFQQGYDIIRAIRPLSPVFSLTMSVVGFKEFSNDEIEKVVSTVIEKKYGWQFYQEGEREFDIRVFIDHNELVIGIRLGLYSLAKRTYKVNVKPGSLKPSVAAALVLYATDGKVGSLVDTFCGSGTILAEGLGFGLDVFGSDIDAESIENTRLNLERVSHGRKHSLIVSDARKTHWPSSYFDFAISNLPWDKQIKVESITNLYIGSIEEYKRILKKQGVLCVLVSKPELFLKHAKYIFGNIVVEQMKIRLLGQSPTVLKIQLGS